MRIDVKKMLFIGAKSNKDAFFETAQHAGIIEFFHSQKVKELPLNAEAQKIAHAIKVLQEYVYEKQENKKDISLAEDIADTINRLQALKGQSNEKKWLIRQELQRIIPFGNFSIDGLLLLEKETGHKARFFFAKQTKHLKENCPSLILINRIQGIEYFFSFADEHFSHPDAIEVSITRSVEELKALLTDLEQTIEHVDEELRQLTRYNFLLHHALIHYINQTSLDHALGSVSLFLDDQLFIIEGWVPNNKVHELNPLAAKHHIYIEEVVIESQEVSPTYLENHGMGRVGEDVIAVFDTPSHLDKDPSLWVLVAFSIFFAMIVNDGGYGLVFLATALFLRCKTQKITRLGRRMLILVVLLGTVCLMWGGLTNAFFGIKFSPNNPLRTYSLMTWLVEKKAKYHFETKDDVFTYWEQKLPSLAHATSPQQFLYTHLPNNDTLPVFEKFSDNIMLELALFVGSIHICLGLLRYFGKNRANIGWVAFIIGAYLYLPTYVNATSFANFVFGIDKVEGARSGLHLLTVGALFALIACVVRDGFLGIFEIMTSIQIFGDILSYLRIYALGLASSIVATLVNEMATALPLVIATILILFSHGLNIILSIMGGTIHGLRLNFLEWYHYSFEGGGKPFRPLCLYNLE